jgi:O-antigen/teichoic acid export membrane protein
MSLAFATFIGHLVAVIQLYSHRNLVKQIVGFKGREYVNWIVEIFPMQWRVALSWMSGFLIYSTFTPIIFKFVGPVEAGKFGLTWSVIQTISSLGQAFILPLSPEFGRLLALNQFTTLRRLWMIACAQGVAVVSLSGIGMCIVLIGLDLISHSWTERFLSPIQVSALFAALALNQITFSIAVLIRAERREPFVWQSIAAGVFVVTGNIVLCIMSLSYLIPTYYLIIQGALLAVCCRVAKTSKIFALPA